MIYYSLVRDAEARIFSYVTVCVNLCPPQGSPQCASRVAWLSFLPTESTHVSTCIEDAYTARQDADNDGSAELDDAQPRVGSRPGTAGRGGNGAGPTHRC